MKPILFALTLCTFALQLNAGEPASGAERGWRRKLSSHTYKIGMTRTDTEKQLGARVLIEFTADHGFAPLHDVYYELDASWCAVIAYAPADKPGDYPNAEHATMRLVVQPRLVSNRPKLLSELRRSLAPTQTPK